MIRLSLSRIFSPHIGHSFAAIDFSVDDTYRTSTPMSRDAFRPLGGEPVALMSADDGRVDVNWFADEVVIDFPSVALAVDRIRRGFLVDEPPPRWQTTVRVSASEARRGTTTPLEVPVRLTCHQCGGRGESWTESCTRCEGTGTLLLHHVVQVFVPAGVIDGDRFYFTVVPRHHTPTRIELRVRVG